MFLFSRRFFFFSFPRFNPLNTRSAIATADKREYLIVIFLKL